MSIEIFTSKCHDILFWSEDRSSIGIITSVSSISFFTYQCLRIIFIHFNFLYYDKLFSFQFISRKLGMNHHISKYIQSLMSMSRWTFYIIWCDFFSSIGIKLSSKWFYRNSDTRWRGIFFASFKKHMLEKMANTIGLTIFIDWSGLNKDLNSRRIGILHRYKESSESLNIFLFKFHRYLFFIIKNHYSYSDLISCCKRFENNNIIFSHIVYRNYLNYLVI